MAETRTYTLEIEVEVKITSHGHPGTGPSFSGPGDPPEGPEFEIGNITITGDPDTVDAQYKAMRAKLEAMGAKPESIVSFDQFFADQIYERITDQANDDDWSDSDDGDYDRD